MIAALLWVAASPASADNHQYAAGLVSIQVTHQAFDPALPWNKNRERTNKGNALVVSGNRLLTTADLVKNANMIVVRKFGIFPDFQAAILRTDYELNLALLTVDDPAFWMGLEPLPISKDPVLRGRLEIKRWRSNGRFEQGSGELVEYRMSTSRFGNLDLPLLRGTASMSGLGWSELLTAGGRVIGLVTGHNGREILALTGGTLLRFIEASRREPYSGFAHRGFSWQPVNNNGIKGFYNLKRSEPGVLVRRVYAGGTGYKVLEPDDILTKFGGYNINPEGKIDHPTFGAITFTVVINETLDPQIPATVIRGGKPRSITLTRQRFSSDVFRVTPYTFDRALDYEVFGGLVIQELSKDYLKRWGKNWRAQAPARLLIEHDLFSLRNRGQKPEKVAFISRVLQDRVNIGYENLSNAIIKEVNGMPVYGLASFREAVRNPKGKYHIIRMLRGHGRTNVIFLAADIRLADRRIRKLYGIPPQ